MENALLFFKPPFTGASLDAQLYRNPVRLALLLEKKWRLGVRRVESVVGVKSRVLSLLTLPAHNDLNKTPAWLTVKWISSGFLESKSRGWRRICS
jgi:hypothetical protein